MIGARWLYLILNPSAINGAISFFSLSGGRSIIGCIIGGMIGTLSFLKIMQIPVDYRMIGSIVMPNLLLGQAIGRWGNFANGEIYGAAVSESSLFWLTPWLKDLMYIDGAYRFPLFLIEFITNLIGWFVLSFGIKRIKQLKPGTHASLYFVWYGLTRAIMEPLRDPKFIMNIGGFPTSLFFSILFILFGLFMFVYLQFYYWDFQEWKTNVYSNKKIYNKEITKLRWSLITNKITKKEYGKSKEKLVTKTSNDIEALKKSNEKDFIKSRKEDLYQLRY